MEKEIILPSFNLLYLNPSIVEQDYEAVKKTAQHIQEITGDSWPDETFSLEDDLEELKIHEQEFLAGESFAYAVRKNGTQIGSLYFYRSNKCCFDFVCTLWTDCTENDILLFKEAKEYMNKFPYQIAYVPFEISKQDYLKKDKMKHKTFGKKIKVNYLDRKGAYIIPILDSKIGVIKTPKGLFLIGGGKNDNESDVDCIKRECLEEIGYAVNVKEKICSAEAFIEHSTIGYFHPIQTYYLGELTNKVKEPIEIDHTLVWIDYKELNGKMYSEIQNYAINETINMFLL